MIRALVGAVALVVATAQGCGDTSSPQRIPDGVRVIGKNMRGTWHAEGGRGCVWSLRDRYGNVIGHGRSTYPANVSQTVIISDFAVGGQLRSDKCKGWTK